MASGFSEAVLFSRWKEGFSIPPSLRASLAEAVAFLFPPSPSSEGATPSIVVSPVTGVVEEANTELEDEPQKLNEDPYGAWIARIRDISACGELMSADEYEAFVQK